MISRSALALALGAICFWSTNAFVAKHVLADTPVALVQFLQFTGAAFVFAALGVMRGRPALVKVGGKPFLVALIGLVGTMVLQYIAFSSMRVIEANLIAYTWPLMVAAGVIWAGRSAKPLTLAGLAIVGFIGAALVITGGRDPILMSGNVIGYTAAIASAACMAAYTLLIGRYTVSVESLLLPSALVGVAGTFGWCVVQGVEWHSGWSLVLGLYLGAGPMGVGYYLWSQALRGDASGRVSILGYLTPIGSTMLLTASGDYLSATAVVGAVLVIASCFAVGLERMESKAHA